MISIRLRSNITREDFSKLKLLKKDFEKVMKKNIFLYEKNEYFKIEKLIKSNNADSFFKKINLIMNKEKEKIDIELDTLVNHYYAIFNTPLSVSQQVINEVQDGINDINHVNFKSIEINLTELNEAIKLGQSSNVCGNDGISSKMIKNCDSEFIASKLFFFFKFIFFYGVVPNDYDVTHIIPIKKEKS